MQTKKHVLEVAYPALNNSGVPAVIMGIIRELREECDFDVLVFQKDVGYHEKEFLSYGGKIHTIECFKKQGRIKRILEKITRPRRIYRGTKKILKSGHYDVIHCHNGSDAGWCLKAAKKMKVPVRIVHSHSTANPFDTGVFLRLYKKIMCNITLSNSTIRTACSEQAGIDLFGENSKTTVILNPIDNNKFNPEKFDGIAIDKESPQLIFVGRIGYQKNPLFLMDIFANIQKQRPQSKLKIIGFGSQSSIDELKEKISSLKLNESVTLLPGDSDVPLNLSRSHIFVLPSIFEGFGIVLIEAQAMGCYCFASDAVPNLTDIGMCRYLPLKNGAEFWAEQILSYIDEHNGERNYPNAEKLNEYSWRTIADEYRKLYKTE